MSEHVANPCGTRTLASRVATCEDTRVIVEVPTPEDFSTAAYSFLNLAWGHAIEVHINYKEASVWEDLGEDERLRYVAKAQRVLATSLAMAQQGVELLLKSEISRVSPYLLVETNKWTKRKKGVSNEGGSDVAFSDFVTIPAGTLVRVCRTVADIDISKSFEDECDRIRRIRNVIFHSAAISDQFIERDVIKWVLWSMTELTSIRWFPIRLQLLEESPYGHLFGQYDEHLKWQASREFNAVLNMLDSEEKRVLLGVEKNLFLCPHCRWGDADEQFDTASLTDDDVGFCHVCEGEFGVVARPCQLTEGCDGRVFSDTEEWERRCLTCGKTND